MRTLVLAIGLLAGATAASAQSAPLVVQIPPVQTAPSIPEPASAATPLAGRAIALDELSTLNGKQGDTVSVAMSQQDLNAVNRGNTVSGDTVGSGQINIGQGAYQGFAGVGNFVINSGHNNNLQGALTINITP